MAPLRTITIEQSGDIEAHYGLSAKAIKMEWQSEYTYKENDIVSYDSMLYKCKTEHISTATFHNDVVNYWQSLGSSSIGNKDTALRGQGNHIYGGEDNTSKGRLVLKPNKEITAQDGSSLSPIDIEQRHPTDRYDACELDSKNSPRLLKSDNTNYDLHEKQEDPQELLHGVYALGSKSFIGLRKDVAENGNKLIGGKEGDSDIDFLWDQRIDQGPHDIYDENPALSTALDNTRGHFKISNKGLNITDPGGLGLEIWAKDMKDAYALPQTGKCLIDLEQRTFVMPSLSYWSKLDQWASDMDNDFINPETSLCGKSTIEYSDGTEGLTFSSVSGKLGQGLQLAKGTSGGSVSLTPVDNIDTTRGALSFWFQIPAGTNPLKVFISKSKMMDQEKNIFYLNLSQNRQQLYYCDLMADEAMVAETNLDLSTGFHHAYIVWDIEGLSDGNTVKVIIDNDNANILTSAKKMNHDFVLFGMDIDMQNTPSLKFNLPVSTSAILDNLKVWVDDIPSEDSQWIYDYENTGLIENERASHPVYGVDDGYRPALTSAENGGVRYFDIDDYRINFAIDPHIYGSEQHNGLSFYIDSIGEDYSSLEVVLHDGNDQIIDSVIPIPYEDIKIGWNYINFSVINLDNSGATQYHYHLYATGQGASYIAPSTRYSTWTGSFLFKEWYKPYNGLYGESTDDVITLLDKQGSPIIPELGNSAFDPENVTYGDLNLEESPVLDDKVPTTFIVAPCVPIVDMTGWMADDNLLTFDYDADAQTLSVLIHESIEEVSPIIDTITINEVAGSGSSSSPMATAIARYDERLKALILLYLDIHGSYRVGVYDTKNTANIFNDELDSSGTVEGLIDISTQMFVDDTVNKIFIRSTPGFTGQGEENPSFMTRYTVIDYSSGISSAAIIANINGQEIAEALSIDITQDSVTGSIVSNRKNDGTITGNLIFTRSDEPANSLSAKAYNIEIFSITDNADLISQLQNSANEMIFDFSNDGDLMLMASLFQTSDSAGFLLGLDFIMSGDELIWFKSMPQDVLGPAVMLFYPRPEDAKEENIYKYTYERIGNTYTFKEKKIIGLCPPSSENSYWSYTISRHKYIPEDIFIHIVKTTDPEVQFAKNVIEYHLRPYSCNLDTYLWSKWKVWEFETATEDPFYFNNTMCGRYPFMVSGISMSGSSSSEGYMDVWDLGKLPTTATKSSCDYMAVDFSDDEYWDSWNYKGYVGVDVTNGRVKFPEGTDVSDYYAQFNMSEDFSVIDAKSVVRHRDDSVYVSVEDTIRDAENTISTLEEKLNDAETIITDLQTKVTDFEERIIALENPV